MTRDELILRTRQLIAEGERLGADPSLVALQTWLQLSDDLLATAWGMMDRYHLAWLMVGKPKGIVRGREMTREEEAAYVREVAGQKAAALRMSLDAVERQGMPFRGETGGVGVGQGMGEVPTATAADAGACHADTTKAADASPVPPARDPARPGAPAAPGRCPPRGRGARHARWPGRTRRAGQPRPPARPTTGEAPAVTSASSASVEPGQQPGHADVQERGRPVPLRRCSRAAPARRPARRPTPSRGGSRPRSAPPASRRRQGDPTTAGRQRRPASQVHECHGGDPAGERGDTARAEPRPQVEAGRARRQARAPMARATRTAGITAAACGEPGGLEVVVARLGLFMPGCYALGRPERYPSAS